MTSVQPEEGDQIIEIGVNTDELEQEELQKLIDNNKELQPEEGDVKINIDEIDIHKIKVHDETSEEHEKKKTNSAEEAKAVQETKELNKVETVTNNISGSKKKSQLISELEEKDKIVDLLKNSNFDLQQKIIKASNEYEGILYRLKQRSAEEDESTLTLKIKEVEKEIFMSNSEIEQYKRSIDSLKNKLEFKINLERAMNLENILKQELLKNKEIRREYESLSKVNTVQIKAISNFDKENRISEKMDILKSEIKIAKESLKDFQEKHSKQEKYIRGLHERLSLLEDTTKKLMIPKVEIKKSFTKDDLKTILELLNKSKLRIKENKKILKSMTKQNEEKLNSFVSHSKKIEADFKENDKINKMLIFKKNELKRIIKHNSQNLENKIEKIENKSTKKIIQNNGDISHILPKKSEMSPEETLKVDNSRFELPPINKENKNESEMKPKLFAKNPNRKSSSLDMQEEANVMNNQSEEENLDGSNLIEMEDKEEGNINFEEGSSQDVNEEEENVNNSNIEDNNQVENFQLDYS